MSQRQRPHSHRTFITSEHALGQISSVLHLLEILLAAIAVVFVSIGTWGLVRDILDFTDLMPNGFNLAHTVFEDLLSDVLLLVVGIELAIMLIRRTPESLIEVMFFVVARKMLIKTETFADLLMGVVALSGLFGIRMFLFRRAPNPPLGEGAEPQ